MGNMFGPRGPSAFDSPPQSRVQPTEQPPVPLRISGPIPKAYHSRGSPPPPPIPPRSSSLPQSYASASLLDPDSIHKGLHNERSAYHCFLNVIIQSLWHLRAFRLRFIALDYNHVHRSDPCIFCALRTIFTQYQYSDSVIIPPDTLRQALHDIDRMQGQGRFLLGAQGDAEEALDEILRWLHADQVLRDKRDDGPGEDDLTCMPPCISHAVFGAQCMDVKVCACGATSDPETSTSFLYRVYVSDLLPRLHSTAPFSHVLRSLYKAQAFSCPTNLADAAYRCQGPARVDRWLLTQPIVFTLMLAWNVGMPREEIQEVWGALPPELLLEDFVRVPEGAGGAVYGLRGVVCWYGKHYVAFFESEVGERWLMFDDRRVSHVGHWEELCTRAVLGKLQPILAFYEKTEKLADSRTLAQSMQPEWHKKEQAELKSAAPAQSPPLPPVAVSASPLVRPTTHALRSFGYGAGSYPENSDMSDVNGSDGGKEDSNSSLSVGVIEHDPFFGLEQTPRFATATQTATTKRR